MKVAFLTRYGDRGASSRVRAKQFARCLGSHGIEASFLPLLSDRYLDAKYSDRLLLSEVATCYLKRLGQLLRLRTDLLWIEKELFPYVPCFVDQMILRSHRYILDLDDAVFHSYDLAKSQIIRRVLGDKIDRLMAGAAIVTAGNSYLARRAWAAGASRVEILPSVVDLLRYPAHAPALGRAINDRRPLRVVWIGSPSTVQYLDTVRRPLERVGRLRALEIRVIGARAPQWLGVGTVSIPWSLQEEASAIGCCDVGIMPLPDSPWERGKCGYKLIQYMACGLPVIGSPVGVNAEIVEQGVDVFLASTDDECEQSLMRLAADADLRRKMGGRGRAKVEARYSVQAVAPRLAALLRSALF